MQDTHIINVDPETEAQHQLRKILQLDHSKMHKVAFLFEENQISQAGKEMFVNMLERGAVQLHTENGKECVSRRDFLLFCATLNDALGDAMRQCMLDNLY